MCLSIHPLGSNTSTRKLPNNTKWKWFPLLDLGHFSTNSISMLIQWELTSKEILQPWTTIFILHLLFIIHLSLNWSPPCLTKLTPWVIFINRSCRANLGTQEIMFLHKCSPWLKNSPCSLSLQTKTHMEKVSWWSYKSEWHVLFSNLKDLMPWPKIRLCKSYASCTSKV